MRDPVRLGACYVAQRDAIEAAWLADPPQSSAAFSEADQLLARWTSKVLAQADTDTRPRFVQRYWSRRNRWAGLRTDPSTIQEHRGMVTAH